MLLEMKVRRLFSFISITSSALVHTHSFSLNLSLWQRTVASTEKIEFIPQLTTPASPVTHCSKEFSYFDIPKEEANIFSDLLYDIQNYTENNEC